MATIADVPGIDDPQRALLERAGIRTARSLLQAGCSDIQAVLARVAGPEEAEAVPSEVTIRQWQRAAVNLERDGAHASAISKVPMAQVISQSDLLRSGIALESIPVAEPVERAARVREREAAEGTSNVKRLVIRDRGGAAPVREARATKLPEPRSAPGEESAGLDSGVGFRSADDQRADSQAERRNRGMSHPDAGRVFLGAVVALLVPLLWILVSAALVTILAWGRFSDWEAPLELAFLPIAYPLGLLLYLVFAAGPRCRLCGQRYFVPKSCRKHERASRSLLGTTFAMARAAVFRPNFRCQFCGTKTRLRS